ncbi:MAG TPA: HDOD domain-containing protein [Opitutaceae bacterium]|nr:HDOD domain-containing protein [Opitutaceae bacterium]
MIAPLLSREALLHVMKNLPAAPRILAQLGQLLLDPNADLTDVIELLKHDTGLTTRVIRVSNSAIYGAGTRAASLEEALLRVGFNEVYRLVGLAAVAQISDDALRNYDVSGARFRENSLFAAFVMEVLAPVLELDPRAAYTAGLLRSTGKIAIDRLVPGPTYSRSYPAAGKSRPIDEWEMEQVGMDNCTAAAVVLEEWKFPTLTSGAIRDHYRPGSTASPMARLLHLAGAAAEQDGYALPGEHGFWSKSEEIRAALRIDDEEHHRATVIARERFERAREAIS